MHQKQKDLVRIAELMVAKGDEFTFEDEDICRGLLEHLLPYYEVPKTTSILVRLSERNNAAFLLPDGRILAFEYNGVTPVLLENEKAFWHFLICDTLETYIWNTDDSIRRAALEDYEIFIAESKRAFKSRKNAEEDFDLPAYLLGCIYPQMDADDRKYWGNHLEAEALAHDLRMDGILVRSEEVYQIIAEFIAQDAGER